MIRVYFVFEDSIDDTGINLSYVDVLTEAHVTAIEKVIEAANSGELWKKLYPDEATEEHCQYSLLETTMTYLDISSLPQEHNAATLLPL